MDYVIAYRAFYTLDTVVGGVGLEEGSQEVLARCLYLTQQGLMPAIRTLMGSGKLDLVFVPDTEGKLGIDFQKFNFLRA